MVVLFETNLALLQLLLLELVHVLLVSPVAEVVRLDYDIKVVLQHQDGDVDHYEEKKKMSNLRPVPRIVML